MECSCVCVDAIRLGEFALTCKAPLPNFSQDHSAMRKSIEAILTFRAARARPFVGSKKFYSLLGEFALTAKACLPNLHSTAPHMHHATAVEGDWKTVNDATWRGIRSIHEASDRDFFGETTMNRYHEPGRPCLCGATDCPSCGPAQGYEVEPADDSDPWDDYDDCDDDGGDYYADQWADNAEDNWRGDRF